MALVLVLSHSFAYRAVVYIFITYLIDSWTYEHFQISVGITYASDAVISMMIILLAHISDKYCMDDHIIMIISTNVAYILVSVLIIAKPPIPLTLSSYPFLFIFLEEIEHIHIHFTETLHDFHH